MAKRSLPFHKDEIQKAILKHLEEACSRSGYRPPDVWDDWLELVHATLEAQPRLIAACIQQERFADTPETLALHERLKKKHKTLTPFRDALQCLLRCHLEPKHQRIRDGDIYDELGEMFMMWGCPSQWHGQFFTPWEFAVLNAKLIAENIEHEVHTRLKAAANTCPFAQATLITGMVNKEQEEGEEWLFTRVLPAILRTGNFEPVTVYDPTCGSGVMLLAVASLIPRWMAHYNLVRFYGQDIDYTCVLMARINMMLHGLNGHGLRLMLATYGISPDDVPVVDVATPVVEEPGPAPVQEVEVAGAGPLPTRKRWKGVPEGQLSFDFLLEQK